MKQNLLVTGGSGTLGSAIIRLAIESGNYNVSTISTNPQKYIFPESCRIFKADLATGEGLNEALKNIELIIHCASDVHDPQHVDFDGTANLIAATDKSVLKNLVYVSIVGIDHTDHPYYMMKLKVEKLIADSGVPYAILRATQFHEYVVTFIKSLKVTDLQIDVPTGLKFQTIAVPELAAFLLGLLTQKAGKPITSIGGPQVMGLEEMTGSYLQATGSQQQIRLVEAKESRELRFRTGANLVPDQKYGQITWDTFLKGIQSK